MFVCFWNLFQNIFEAYSIINYDAEYKKIVLNI